MTVVTRNWIIRFFIFWVLLLLVWFFLGCQQVPTKVYENRRVDIGPVERGSRSELVIDDSTVVIDTRSAFAYTMSHFPKSIRLDWKDFSDPLSPYVGTLKKDLFAEARRLARLGVGPNSKVIVVGNELTPDAGRLSWILFYMGVKDVQFSNIQYFSGPFVNLKATPYDGLAIWKPNYESSSLVSADDLRALAKGAVDGAKIRVIDVRSQKSYLKNPWSGVNGIKAINIPWTEFLTPKGRPNLELGRKLEAIGIRKSDSIYVVSERGIKSAAVTMALYGMGFSKAANYAAGLKEYFSNTNKF